MAALNYFTVVFSDTDLSADNELTLPSILPVSKALDCFITYNVTPAIETQRLTPKRISVNECKVSLSEKVVGTGHIATVTYN